MKTTTEPMTAEEFRQHGEALYGGRWRSRLAKELGRDIRTIRRWGSGESPVPGVVAEKLRELPKQEPPPHSTD